MSLRNVIPDEIPSQIKNYDDIILYALGAIGPLERDQFINDPENDVTNRMNKNTFHKWAKELKRMNFIEVEPAGKNRIYKITPNGENELLRRLKNYQLDFESVNKIEQNRIKKYVEGITKFFERLNIIDDDIKIEFLELANEITIDKINIFTEEKINKSILFLVLNHPKFFLLYDVSVEDYINEINKTSEDFLTLTDLKMFLQLVIEEDIYNLKFYSIKIRKENKNLYFKADSQYGVMFEAIIKKKLRNLNYLKNIKNLKLNTRELINDVVDSLVNDYKLFDIFLRDNLYQLVEEYIKSFKESITERAIFKLTDYKQYFSVFEELQSSLNQFIRKNPNQEQQLTMYEKYKDIFTKPPWDHIIKASDIKEASKKYVQEHDEYSEKLKLVVENIEKSNYYQIQEKIKELILIIQEPELAYLLVSINIIIDKKYEESLDLLDEYKNLKIIPEGDYKYYYLKAWIFNLMKKHEYALKCINKGINLNADKVKLKYCKFSILKTMQKFDEALNTIKEMIEINPSVTYFLEKSMILLDLKRYDDSIQSIDTAIALKPNNELLYLFKIQEILTGINNESEILTEYSKIMKQFPENFLIKKYFSLYLKEIMNFEEALLKINEAIALNPKNIEQSQIKIDILNSLQKYDELIKFIKNYNKIEIFNYGINNLINYGKFDEALNLTTEALDKLPQPQSQPWESIIEKDGFYDTSIPKSFEKMKNYFLSLNKEKRSSFIYTLNFLILQGNRHHLLSILNEEESLITETKYILDNDKNHMFYEFLKIEYLFKTNNYEKLFDYIDELVSQNAYYISGLLNSLAYNCIRKFKQNIAIRIIQKAIQLKPMNSNYYDSYGEILLLSNDYDEAIKQFEKAIEINPEDYFIHESYIKMGECFLKIKKTDLALEFLNKGKLIAEEREKERWVSKANTLIKVAKKEIRRNYLIASH